MEIFGCTPQWWSNSSPAVLDMVSSACEHQTSALEHQCWTSEHQRTSVQGELRLPRLYAPAPESVGSNSPPWPGGTLFQIFSRAGLLAGSLNQPASHQFERQRTRSYFCTSVNISSRTSVFPSEHPNSGDRQSSSARAVDRQCQSGEVDLWCLRVFLSSFN